MPDGNGVLSEEERRAYAERVLGDLSLTLNGERLTLRLAAVEFPKIEELKEGRGEIHLEFEAVFRPGGCDGRLAVENRHHSAIAAYQVNCLVPRDPAIRVEDQRRSQNQTRYEVTFTQTRSETPR